MLADISDAAAFSFLAMVLIFVFGNVLVVAVMPIAAMVFPKALGYLPWDAKNERQDSQCLHLPALPFGLMG